MSDKHYIGQDLVSFTNKGKYKPVSRVTLMIDDENCVTAGDDTGMELKATCYHATQAMADALLTQFKGYEYPAFEAEAANLDPSAELGDGITADGLYSVISRLSDDGSGYPSPSAPGEAEMEDEYPSAGPMTQEFNRKIAQTKVLIKKTAELFRVEVAGAVERVENAEDDIAAMDKTAGELRDDVDAVEERVTKFEVSLDGVSAEVTDNKNAVAALELELGNIETRVQDAEGNISKVTQKVDSFTIEVSSGSTTAQIKLKAGDTVVGSGTIEMTGLVSFTGLEDGTTIIHGRCVSTGKIQDKTGENYWDLDNGVLVLKNTEIDGTDGEVSFTNCPIYTIASKTWEAADHTWADYTELTNILINMGNNGYIPTSEELEKYDFDLDGQLTDMDSAFLYYMIQLGEDIATSWQLKIDPLDKDEMLKVWRTYHGPNGMGTAVVDIETIVFQASMAEVFAKNLRVFGGLTLQGYDVPKIVLKNPYTGDEYTGCHTGNTGLSNLGISDLNSSNTTATVTYPTGTVGFHVYGYPVSGASMVGMFIPLSLCDGTSFQLADDGNYVTFTMTADTSAQTITITRTGGAGWVSSVHPLYFGATT